LSGVIIYWWTPWRGSNRVEWGAPARAGWTPARDGRDDGYLEGAQRMGRGPRLDDGGDDTPIGSGPKTRRAQAASGGLRSEFCGVLASPGASRPGRLA